MINLRSVGVGRNGKINPRETTVKQKQKQQGSESDPEWFQKGFKREPNEAKS